MEPVGASVMESDAVRVAGRVVGPVVVPMLWSGGAVVWSVTEPVERQVVGAVIELVVRPNKETLTWNL